MIRPIMVSAEISFHPTIFINTSSTNTSTAYTIEVAPTIKEILLSFARARHLQPDTVRLVHAPYVLLRVPYTLKVFLFL